MPDGHCRWPSFRVGGGETLHHELPTSTVRVSDKKSVRVRRCRLGGIWRDFVGPTCKSRAPMLNSQIWPTSDRSLPLTRRHVSSPSMNSPTLKKDGPTPKKVNRHRALRGRNIIRNIIRSPCWRQNTRAAWEVGSGRGTSPFSKKRTATVWSNPFAPFARQNPRVVPHRTPPILWQNPHFQRG